MGDMLVCAQQRHRIVNPDKQTSYRRKLVSTARAIVTYEVGLPLGCARMARILSWLRPYDDVEFPIFDEYQHATAELPTGQERLHWDRRALRELDVRLEALNREFRDRVFESCYVVIDRFGNDKAATDETVWKGLF